MNDGPIPFLLFNEIGIIEHLSRTAFERVLPEGLSAAGFAVLNHFVRLELSQSSPARLAGAFQVTKGAMTNTLQRLEAMGLVSVDPDPADGRGKVVRLTPAGRATREAAIAKVEPLFADLLAQISAAELAAILPVLTRVRKILDAARG